MEQQKVILFDGVCNLCNWSIRFISKRDPNKVFTMIAIQSSEGRALAKRHQLQINDPQSVILLEKGNIYYRSRAGIKIMESLEGTKTLSKILDFLPEKINDYFYNFIAKRRYSIFGKKNYCEF